MFYVQYKNCSIGWQGCAFALQPANPYEQQDQPRRAVIYVRVLHEEQALGHSLEAQERECREYLLKNKPNWELVDIYTDEHSGKTDKRPGFQKMMDVVESGQADTIVCHHLDRFSRSLHDILTYFKQLEAKGTILAFSKEDFDFSTPDGMLHFHILAVFADWYLKNLARETKKGKFSRLVSGKSFSIPRFSMLLCCMAIHFLKQNTCTNISVC